MTRNMSWARPFDALRRRQRTHVTAKGRLHAALGNAFALRQSTPPLHERRWRTVSPVETARIEMYIRGQINTGRRSIRSTHFHPFPQPLLHLLSSNSLDMSDTGRQSWTDKASAAMKVRCAYRALVWIGVLILYSAIPSPTARNRSLSKSATPSRATMTPSRLLPNQRLVD